MPPPLALALTIVFISGLLWRDFRTRPPQSAALWLPVIWLFFVGSRYVSQWLNLLGFPVGGAVSQEGGSPIDAAFFFVLIISGLLVLIRRRGAILQFVGNNKWLTIFLIYSFLAIAWSDFPAVAFKRWIKILGHPIMASIVLSDPVPREALRTVLRRSSYLLIPPSILFIKYYPQFGRAFDAWTGAATNVGIANSKNDLGYVCAMCGLFFSWNLLSSWRLETARDRRVELALSVAFLWMVWWLQSMTHSSTALVCTLIGVGAMVMVSTRLVSRRFIGTYVVVGLVILITAQLSFSLYDTVVVDVLSKDATLTDRTAVWQDAIGLAQNSFFGAGFESFWLGPRLDTMWAKWWWHPIQAHNGYIETYLNLGWIGLALLLAVIISTFRKTRLALIRDVDFGRFRLGVLFAIIVYNYTEATFQALHPLWTLFYLIATDFPTAESVTSEGSLAGLDTPVTGQGFRWALNAPAARAASEPKPLVLSAKQR